MEFFAKRIGDTLWAADEISQAELDRVPMHKLVHVEVRQERNAGRHRLYFALVRIIARAFDQDEDDVDYKLRVAVGHCRDVHFPGGRIEKRALTIRWSEMDELAFTPFFEKIVRAIYELYGILPKDTQARLDEILAPKAEMTR